MSLIDIQHINQKIKHKLFEIAYVIKCFNQNGDNDINRYAELYFMDILNKLYKAEKWNFEKAKRINQDTYDLYDNKNRVCIQITSNIASTKKQQTIKTFIKNDHKSNFDELIILFLSEKKPKGKINIKIDFKYNDYNIIEFASLIESRCGQTELCEIRDILYYQHDLPKQNLVKNSSPKITEEEFLKLVKLEEYLKKELLLPEYWKYHSNEETYKNPYLKFKSSRFILRAIDDETYPAVEENSKWNRTFMYDFYEKGILIWIGAVAGYKVLINKKDEWFIRNFEDRDKPIPDDFSEANLRILGKLPFINIVHLKEGDDYYRDHHLYCKYDGQNDTPFEELIYVYSYSDQGYFKTELDKKKQLTA